MFKINDKDPYVYVHVLHWRGDPDWYRDMMQWPTYRDYDFYRGAKKYDNEKSAIADLEKLNDLGFGWHIGFPSKLFKRYQGNNVTKEIFELWIGVKPDKMQNLPEIIKILNEMMFGV